MIWVGGLVTTYDAGMAVPDWPSTYGDQLHEYPLSKWISGPFDLFIEHGHRLLGAFVGILTIGLVAVTFVFDKRNLVRGFSVACLAGVIVQGLIGGARVIENEVLLARLHGCTGPLFFCMTVVMVLLTSQTWQHQNRSYTDADGRLFRIAAILTIVSYAQLVLGANLRHITAMTTPMEFRSVAFGHVGTAIAIAVYAIALWNATRKTTIRQVAILGRLIPVLVLTQICLGVGTWFVKYNWPTWLPMVESFDQFVVQEKGFVQAIVTTAHVAMGSLILAASLAASVASCPVRFAANKQSTTRKKGVTRNSSSVRMEAIA
ncbi:MAG: COX15/CtaA family protein [Planctomycetales bacterium]|nr:COX15/CtaA family protein [Planctomycetales bacterium]